MKCDLCGGQTGHYTEYGLDNMYLRNLEVQACTACDARAPCLPHILELYNVIQCAITELPAVIEVRGEPLVVLANIGKPHFYSY